MIANSFPPVISAEPRILVLGSMPGKASLQAQQYYAHPRNLFWPFIQNILGVDAAGGYTERCEALVREGVAVWDVLQSCERPSSLDADIIESSIVPNDFAALLSQNVGIQKILFNGAKAHKAFMKYVAPDIEHLLIDIQLIPLPSTSPANASIRREVKLAAWRDALCD